VDGEPQLARSNSGETCSQPVNENRRETNPDGRKNRRQTRDISLGETSAPNKTLNSIGQTSRQDGRVGYGARLRST
jgi:hypothetical protein